MLVQYYKNMKLLKISSGDFYHTYVWQPLVDELRTFRPLMQGCYLDDDVNRN